MSRGRMEAFSDGVLAIVITIMVLKLNAPKDLTLDAVKEVFPTFLAYILSFIYVGIYWANHHHLINMTDSVSGRLLWEKFTLDLLDVIDPDGNGMDGTKSV